MNDEYADHLNAPETAAIAFTDALIGDPHRLSDDLRAELAAHYSNEQIVEMALGVGLFLGMSKVLINLGLEPEQMDTTIIPAPGS